MEQTSNVYLIDHLNGLILLLDYNQIYQGENCLHYSVYHQDTKVIHSKKAEWKKSEYNDAKLGL